MRRKTKTQQNEPKKDLRSRPDRPLRGRHRRPEKIYSFDEANDRLFDIFRNHNFAEVDHHVRHQLVQFYQLLMAHQQKENVTRLLKFREVAIKHFIDCLMITGFTELQFPLLDVGTGPGFPGIPLKILYPDQRIILAEGVRKRVDFLKAVREQMQFKELDIIGRKIDPEFELPMKMVITRAVMEIPDTLLAISRCLEIGGRMVFMKGPNCDNEIKQAEKQWSDHFQLREDIHYELPKTPHQRRLVIYEKIKTPTDEELKQHGYKGNDSEIN